MRVISTNVDSFNVFICDGYGIADKENRLGGSTSNVIIAGADIPFRKIQIKIQPFFPA